MKFTVRQIAELLNAEVEGNPDATVDKLSKIESAEPGSISFLANPIYTQYIYETKASAVIVNHSFLPEIPLATTLIRVENAYDAFAKLLEFYNQSKLNKTGISDKSSIAATAVIGSDVFIGDFCVIGENVQIGDHVRIFPNTVICNNSSIGKSTILYAGVKIYSDSQIGESCIIHAGVVIGSDGFGFSKQDDQQYKKIAQIGNVIIEDNVEIGSNSTIDRATLGSTIIRRGVKLDNLIQVAHNVEIGENTVIAAQVGIAGSTRIGRNCMIGGQAGIAGHITIADDVKIAARSGVSSSITKVGVIVIGNPAIDASIFRRSIVHFKNLDRIYDDVKKLKDAVLGKK